MVLNIPLGEIYPIPAFSSLSVTLARKCNPVIAVSNFKGVKYCILEKFNHIFRWVWTLLIWLKSYFLISLTGKPLLLKFHVLKWTVVKFKCFPFFKPSNYRFGFHNKMKWYLVLSLSKTTWNIFSDHNAIILV